MPGRVYGTQRLQSTPGKVAAGPAPCPLVLHPLTGFTELRTHTTSTEHELWGATRPVAHSHRALHICEDGSHPGSWHTWVPGPSIPC